MKLFHPSNNHIGAIVFIMLGILSFTVVSQAHEHSDHEESHSQMNKLHSMMPIFSDASGKLDLAIEKGDVSGLKLQADRILKFIPDLIKTKPHKNANQIAEYKAVAGKLREDISRVVSLADKGDFTSAQRAFRDVQKRCAACHARFRN